MYQNNAFLNNQRKVHSVYPLRKYISMLDMDACINGKYERKKTESKSHIKHMQIYKNRVIRQTTNKKKLKNRRRREKEKYL